MKKWIAEARQKADEYISERKLLGKTTNIDDLRGNIGDRRIAAGLKANPERMSFTRYDTDYSNFKHFLSVYCGEPMLAKDFAVKLNIAEYYFGVKGNPKVFKMILDFETCDKTKKDDIIMVGENPYEIINLSLYSKMAMIKGNVKRSIKNIPIMLKICGRA